jgi:hypothetical protein
VSGPYVTIWRADSPLSRCRECGAMQQFHGKPNFSCTSFVAETAADIEPGDLSGEDLAREIARLGYPADMGLTGWTTTDADIERSRNCRDELRARVLPALGVDWDDLLAALAAPTKAPENI